MNLAQKARVVAARAEPRYRLWLKFADGAEGSVDLAHLLDTGIFAAWHNPSVWESVTVDPTAGTVFWPGGIDLDPIALYCTVTGAALPGSDSGHMRAAS